MLGISPLAAATAAKQGIVVILNAINAINAAALIPVFGAFIGCGVGVVLIFMVNPMKALIFVVVFLVLISRSKRVTNKLSSLSIKVLKLSIDFY